MARLGPRRGIRPGRRDCWIALVGLNGTGRTTPLRILAGELRPDRGRARRHPVRCGGAPKGRRAVAICGSAGAFGD
ncbi:ATP-binding cassette domain-containing protein [Streptoverticillium reticulum]|uniref:ATP-binding cassette domain-containing protein n=1 Tax=Streptoverticillium reticulum TaxID=1433415 RepID=UPI0039BEE557